MSMLHDLDVAGIVSMCFFKQEDETCSFRVEKIHMAF
jgi:hypothetical protein